MRPLTTFAHEAIADVLKPGDVAIDATSGNGHDTLFLAETVGHQGTVIAFDIQEEALQQAKERCRHISPETIQFYQHSHEAMLAVWENMGVPAPKAIMFNLGYLPGADRKIQTLPKSTISALTTAVDLLAPGGCLTVLAYRGHAGGLEEANAVEEFLAALDEKQFLQSVHSGIGETSPILFIITKTST